jgi:four helix bundle protein
MNAGELADRSKGYAIRIITFARKIPNQPVTHLIARQLVKAATSSAANYRAACRARSRAEFFAKISIVVEEADETLFWLEVIEGSGIAGAEEIGSLHAEGMELLKIFSASRKTASPPGGSLKKS